MVGDPERLRSIAERLQLGEIGAIERVGAADRERHAVHRDRVALGHAIEEVQGPPLRLHVVLAEDLEPVDGGGVLEDVCIVHGPQPQADAEVRKREAIQGTAP